MADKASRTVFIGNIPYGQSEEQIKEICGTVGQVVSFRPIYDSDTGRPKGFGFVEYADSDAAASAVRNLNGYKIDSRELRVAFSKRSDDDGGGDSSMQAQPQFQQQAHTQYPPNPTAPQAQPYPPPPAGASSVGPLPPGVDVPAGMTCQDVISKTLSTLPPPQLLDILSQMKNLVTGDPAKATELLRQAPQLSYAIFQALLLMGLVDGNLIGSVVQQAAAAGNAGPPQTAPSVMAERPGPPPQPTPLQGYGGPVGHVPTPPQHQSMYNAPPPQQPPQQMHQQPQPPNQADLLRQVLDMPQAKVDALPPDQRAQIMQLKQQYGGRIGY